MRALPIRGRPLFLERHMGLHAVETPKAPQGKKPKKLPDTRKQRISKLLKKVEKALNVAEMKITLADFIRLTQLERELEEEDQPREIIITWKDPMERRGG